MSSKFLKLKDNGQRLVLSALIFILLMSDAGAENSGHWIWVGDAYIDRENGYAVLTRNDFQQVGAIWLDEDQVLGPITVRFKYKAGGGSLGADGLVFMFYKEFEDNPPGGLNLGFGRNGYGIEFDSSHNPRGNDPFCNGRDHIALIKDNTLTHLMSECFDKINDNRWHNVEIRVADGTVKVNVDGSDELYWNGGFNQDYRRIGFSAATGGGNDWHIIDDIYIEYHVWEFVLNEWAPKSDVGVQPNSDGEWEIVSREVWDSFE